MRMKEGFDKGVDKLSRCFIRREEFGSILAPVGAELGRGNKSTVCNRRGVPVGIKERIIKLKRRKHINDVEV